MCNYCSEENEDRYIQIFKDKEGDYMLSIESDHWDDYYDGYDCVSVQIDYCPFCGRKL